MEIREKELELLATKARKLIVDSLICAGCGHPGGALSSVDIMTTLFFDILNIDPERPNWEERDHFILSKGHSSVGLYAVMCLRGFFEKEVMTTFRQDDSILGGHPDMRKVPGIEISTGSLGHGLSVGVGMALAGKIDGTPNRVFVLMGDGETQEGSIWEAAMSAHHFKLDNLIGIVDRNRLQIDGTTEEIMALEPYREKWEAFGWNVEEIDGHDYQQILKAFTNNSDVKNKPRLIIANTVKGKGVSFMENQCQWHGGAPSGELAEIAQNVINDNLEQLTCRNNPCA
jgi:transketolase